MSDYFDKNKLFDVIWFWEQRIKKPQTKVLSSFNDLVDFLVEISLAPQGKLSCFDRMSEEKKQAIVFCLCVYRGFVIESVHIEQALYELSKSDVFEKIIKNIDAAKCGLCQIVWQVNNNYLPPEEALVLVSLPQTEDFFRALSEESKQNVVEFIYNPTSLQKEFQENLLEQKKIKALFSPKDQGIYPPKIIEEFWQKRKAEKSRQSLQHAIAPRLSEKPSIGSKKI